MKPSLRHKRIDHHQNAQGETFNIDPDQPKAYTDSKNSIKATTSTYESHCRTHTTDCESQNTIAAGRTDDGSPSEYSNGLIDQSTAKLNSLIVVSDDSGLRVQHQHQHCRQSATTSSPIKRAGAVGSRINAGPRRNDRQIYGIVFHK